MSSHIDLKLPKDIVVKDPQAAIQAILNICRDSQIKGRMGSTNIPAVKCDVEGLTLGHWYKLWEALGPDVCSVIEAVKAQQPEDKEIMNTTVKLVKPSIEQRKFDEFMRKFKDGKFGTQRLGQAFYNEFNLHRIDDQNSLHNLYAKDGEHAVNSIKEIFTFN